MLKSKNAQLSDLRHLRSFLAEDSWFFLSFLLYFFFLSLLSPSQKRADQWETYGGTRVLFTYIQHLLGDVMRIDSFFGNCQELENQER